MGNNGNDIEFSAYADGELDAARTAALAAHAQAEPELRRTLASYKILDEAAAQLPVPAMSEAVSRKAWTAVAEMTTRVTAADRRACARLEQAAAALPVPAMAELAVGKVWRGVAERTTEVSAADRRAFARMDAGAAALPVPQLSDAALARAQESVTLRTTQSGVPAVSGQQWDRVWQGIREKTQRAAEEPSRAPHSAITRVDFGGARRRWFMAASLAAAVVFAVLVFVLRAPDEQIAMLDVPEALDERYQVQVKYVEGESAPVVCFFLKDDTAADKTPEKWRWLPE
jgi:hypothetical protein